MKKIYDSVVAKRCGCFAAGLGQIVPKTTQCIRPTKYLKIYPLEFIVRCLTFASIILSILDISCNIWIYRYLIPLITGFLVFIFLGLFAKNGGLAEYE